MQIEAVPFDHLTAQSRSQQVFGASPKRMPLSGTAAPLPPGSYAAIAGVRYLSSDMHDCLSVHILACDDAARLGSAELAKRIPPRSQLLGR